jgi:hypothetical protein
LKFVRIQPSLARRGNFLLAIPSLTERPKFKPPLRGEAVCGAVALQLQMKLLAEIFFVQAATKLHFIALPLD